jgi:SET domain-containing protein
MTLYSSDPDDRETPEHVRVSDTIVGKGVFATRPYPATAIVGKITGKRIVDEHYESEHTFEFGSGVQLEPAAPFRFLNHSCEPNCEFDLIDEFDPDVFGPMLANLYVVALRNIQPDEELTIDYNWPATSAIPCMCGAESCRGWVVAEYELEKVES